MQELFVLFFCIINFNVQAQNVLNSIMPQMPLQSTFEKYDSFNTAHIDPNSSKLNYTNTHSSTQLQHRLAEKQFQQQQREQTLEALEALDKRIKQRTVADADLDTFFGKNPPVLTKDKYIATKPFWDAMVVLTDMGEGKRTFSITEAVYTVENAYLKDKLSKNKFYSSVNAYAALCKQIMAHENLDTNNDLSRHYAIQKLYQQDNYMIDPKTKQKIKVPRLEYDFTDFMGDSSHAQMFVSKLLSTGRGQCHSMPLLYLAIAEQLGAKANLSIAPEHSFIRFPDNEGNFYNFECTNGNIVSDKWMLRSGYISTVAVRNKIYLDTLPQHQLLAMCMLDLAMGYIYDHGYDSFTEVALKHALPLDPKGIQGNIMLANFWTVKTKKASLYYNLRTKEQFERNVVAQALQRRMLQQYDVVDGLGYQHMPKEAYELWLKSVNEQKQLQDERTLQQALQYQFQKAKMKTTTTIKRD